MDNLGEKWSFKKEDLITVPNLITYLRFILIVPFAYFFINEKYIYSLIFIGASGLTDCIDGFLARKLNQVTSLGKILDPIADKVTLLVVVMCMVILTPAIVPLLIILLVKDVLMLLGGTDLINKGLYPPAAKWYGKLGTIVFYFSVGIIVFLKAFFDYENYGLEIILLSITVITMMFALYQYGRTYFQMIKGCNESVENKKDGKNDENS